MQQISPYEPGKVLLESDEEFWLFGYGEDHRGTPECPGRVVTLIERFFWETLGEEVRNPFPPSLFHLKQPQSFPPLSLSTLKKPSSYPKHLHQPSSTPTRVYGAAYHIPTPHIQIVKSYLDIREINGYSIQYTPFIPIPTNTDSHFQPPIPKCTVYIGLPNNPQFLGKQDPQDVAAVIAKSVGPSGKNSEYLFMLEEALEGLAPESGDGHVGDLARRVRGLMGGGEGEGAFGEGQRAWNAVENEAERVRSGIGRKPVEEVEKVT